ncbi:MAG: hypothetical protein CME71_06305 [Halobacteriovorax sp.]|nr:hypothetical protein [Halobacteriovorax sp.]
MSERYNIQLASKISGVGVHTIRAWEKRYQAVTPARNDKGRREYSQKEIERLSLLSELCTLGHSIGQIANTETLELKKLLKKLGKQTADVESNELRNLKKPLVDIDMSLSSLLMALATDKLDIISHEIGKLKLLLSPREFALDIISPLLNEVGNKVVRGELSISQEHALSAILKFHIGHLLFKHYAQKSTKALTFIIASPEDDYHEFGIMQAALLCAHYNLNFFYLGPNMPLQSLLDTYQSVEANRIILGATKGVADSNEEFLNDYIARLMKGLNSEDKLLFGGTANFDYERFSGQKKFRSFINMKAFDNYLKDL